MSQWIAILLLVASVLPSTARAATQEPFKHALISSPRYNLDRSARRAQSVVNYLQSKGVETARLESVGKGFTELLNNTDPLAAENRRVRIKALP